MLSLCSTSVVLSEPVEVLSGFKLKQKRPKSLTVKILTNAANLDKIGHKWQLYLLSLDELYYLENDSSLGLS